MYKMEQIVKFVGFLTVLSRQLIEIEENGSYQLMVHLTTNNSAYLTQFRQNVNLLDFACKVKGGSKMSNLMNHASSLVETGGVRTMVWSGFGVGIGKAVSCAEIMKRNFSIPHQVTKICYRKVEEYWEPKLDGLETLVVKREIPVIHILLSLDPVDTTQTGYQSRTGKKFWQCDRQASSQQQASYSKPKKSYKNKPKPAEHS